MSRFADLAGDARERFSFLNQADPDVHALEFEKFGIEDARELVRTASLQSVGGRALYIVGIASMTTEAQQALLKLFEEPQAGTMFVLLVPHGATIATLRSRLLPYPMADIGEEKKGSGAAKFLASPYAARSADITKLLKDDEGVKERVRELLASLESTLHTALLKSKGRKDIREGLEDLAKVRSYTNDRSASLKMLLEHLAVVLPKI
jgi:DNA polymerase III gamma/tau subunit